ncbi:hypothetical protein MAPG_02792 [Magnaporthiopsis poae ATCC 64411]|uniref:GLEYA adhesin domain-containing protein n=1 Tax=Magnaporthiopsis poae (strain ATCC 64411 / 73-15) TaxID=644358 RepID=A0A0C4DSB4_MAGP6|nr:hypothetical protein MAPG_02792 [Magnaporthiopsis poae ATCC 64411]
MRLKIHESRLCCRQVSQSAAQAPLSTLTYKLGSSAAATRSRTPAPAPAGLHGHDDNGHDILRPPSRRRWKAAPRVSSGPIMRPSRAQAPAKSRYSHSNTSPYWDTFSPDNIKGLTLFSTGWGKRMSIGKGQGECIASPAYVNGVAQASGSHHAYSVLQACGCIVADRVTTYHIYFNSAGELALGWFGDEANGNWNSDNARLVTGRYAYRAIQAKAGDVIPFRILYINAQGCYSFGFTIYKETPGQVGWDAVLSSDYDNSSNNIAQS